MSIYFYPSLNQFHRPAQRPQIEVAIDRIDQPACRVPKQPRHHHRIDPLLRSISDGKSTAATFILVKFLTVEYYIIHSRVCKEFPHVT